MAAPETSDPLDPILRRLASAPSLEPIGPGTVLGSYRIERKLGAGGMGEVFAAEDRRLGRTVALKLLPPEVTADPSRRARFEREARTLATLNHPGIVTVHAVESEGGRPFLVMELVVGRPLSALIAERGGGLPARELLRLASALAEALGAAHLHGVVHRDVKPDNVMVTDGGRLKVLDFGLAKVDAPPAEDAPTATATVEGRVVGTAAYMSPEQAEGRSTDPRSDVFSLGIVLYEMATGHRPFTGDSTLAVLSSILRDTPPPVDELSPKAPGGFARVVRRCLEKQPERRYQSALDVRNDLEEIAATAAAPAARRGWRRRAVLATAVSAIAALAGLGGYLVRRPSPAASAAVVVERVVQLTRDEGAEWAARIAPDGTWFVYCSERAGNWDLYRQRVGGEHAMNLTAGHAGADLDPAISPDGERIAFYSDRDGGGVFVMGATGEAPRRVSDFGTGPSWTLDGKELLVGTETIVNPRLRGANSEVWAVEVETGKRRRLLEGDAVEPVLSPHGERIAFWQNQQGRRDIMTAPAAGGARTHVTDDAAVDFRPAWVPDGTALLFASDRGGSTNLWLQPIDERSGRTLAAATPLTLGVGIGIHSPSFASDGRSLLFVAGEQQSYFARVGVDLATGRVAGEPERLTQAQGLYAGAVRGGRLVFGQQGASEDIVVLDLATRQRQRLTDGRGLNRHPRFSPDGKLIAFDSTRGGVWEVWTIHPDGSGLTRVMTGLMPVFSPDGKRLAVHEYESRDVTIVELARPERPVASIPAPTGAYDFWVYDWSADGRSLVGTSMRADRALWLLPVDGRPVRRLGDTTAPTANFLDGRRVLLAEAEGLRTVDVETGVSVKLATPGLSIGANEALLDGQWLYFMQVRTESDVWLAHLAPSGR